MVSLPPLFFLIVLHRRPCNLSRYIVPIKMKYSAAIALAAVGGSSAYSVNRSTLRSLGQKNVGVTARPQKRVNANEMKMEGKFFWYVIAMFYIIYITTNDYIIHKYLYTYRLWFYERIRNWL